MVRGAKRRDLSNIWVEMGCGKSIHEMRLPVDDIWKMSILYLGYPSLALSENDRVSSQLIWQKVAVNSLH